MCEARAAAYRTGDVELGSVERIDQLLQTEADIGFQ